MRGETQEPVAADAEYFADGATKRIIKAYQSATIPASHYATYALTPEYISREDANAVTPKKSGAVPRRWAENWQCFVPTAFSKSFPKAIAIGSPPPAAKP